MAQSEQFHEVWAYLRDNAKPVVPDDVGQLAEVREMKAPSKAHIKRIRRARPTVTPAQKFLVVGDDPGGMRAQHNAILKRAADMLAKHKGILK